ncbi:MAG: ComEC/Rec2 family competence protein [Ignavibacteria bacterium]|nr:ComEC/Rec2 family competence protein [Ignavibacteria bacterium]
MRRRPLLRFAIIVLAIEVFSYWLGFPADPRMLDVVSGAPEWFIEPQRSRISGYIESIVGKTLIVNGEIDCKNLPCVYGRVKLTVLASADRDSAMLTQLTGSRIVAFGTVHRPTETWYHGQFDEVFYAQSHRIVFIGTCDVRDMRVLEGPTQPRYLLEVIRSAVSERIDATFSPDVAAYMHALLVGNTQHLEKETRITFSNSGTSHILAVSGMHVTLIVGLLLVLSGGRPRNPVSLIIISCIIVVYVIITGAEPPAVRAGIMCIAGLLGRVLQRDVDVLNLLGGSVLIQVLIEPTMVFNHGFILSTCATFSILTLGFDLRRVLIACLEHRTRWKRGLVNMLSINLSATAGVALPAALLYGQAPIYSPLTNCIVVPLFSAALILGIIAVILCTALPSFFTLQAVAFLPDTIIRAAVKVVEAASSITPELTQPTAVLMAIGTMLSILWISHSVTFRAILSKVTISSALMAFAILIAQPRVNQLVISPTHSGLQMYVASPTEQREVQLRMRNGVVFVRSREIEPRK